MHRKRRSAACSSANLDVHPRSSAAPAACEKNQVAGKDISGGSGDLTETVTSRTFRTGPLRSGASLARIICFAATRTRARTRSKRSAFRRVAGSCRIRRLVVHNLSGIIEQA